MLFSNAYVFQGEEGFVRGSLRVENGKITEVIRETAAQAAGGEDAADLQGMYVIPGLIDIHSHGNSGYDFSDGSEEGVREMGRYYARNGITSFAPASMTLPYDKLERLS